MTPVFSWSDCVIFRVLSCFYFLEGVLPFLCFVCVSSSCLAERCYFSSFGLVLGVSGQDRVFYDIVFMRFGALDFLRFFVGCCYFSSFGYFFIFFHVFSPGSRY